MERADVAILLPQLSRACMPLRDEKSFGSVLALKEDRSCVLSFTAGYDETVMGHKSPLMINGPKALRLDHPSCCDDSMRPCRWEPDDLHKRFLPLIADSSRFTAI